LEFVEINDEFGFAGDFQAADDLTDRSQKFFEVLLSELIEAVLDHGFAIET
jgi:hypothetical protein